MKICDILHKQGCVEEEDIEKALRIQAGSARPIGDILQEIGAVGEKDLRDALTFQSDLSSDRSSGKKEFIRSIEPFNSLDDAAIDDICAAMEWREFSVGQTVQKEGGKGTSFFIFRNGLARITMVKEGEEKVVGFLGEGDFCGAAALLSDGIHPSTVTVIEPSLCLVQDEPSFRVMVGSYPGVAGYFNELIIRQTKRIFTRLLAAGTEAIQQVEPFLYSKRVRDLMSDKQVICARSETLGESARRLIEAGVSTAVVVDDGGKLLGSVGLKDLAEASLVKGRDAGEAVGGIAGTECAVVSADSYFFDALHMMMKRGTDTLIVMTGEAIEGVLTSLDLLKFRGREVLSLIRNIEEAGSYDELNARRLEVEDVLRVLMADGALASHACRIVSELNDKVVKRVISLAEKALGPAPVPFVWLGLGSEGRKEQTLLTDQDNAILFEGGGAAAAAYFTSLAEHVVAALNTCGFPLCKGNIMATNPRYFGDLATWQEKARSWIEVSAVRGNDLIDIYTFLDFRGVYGSEELEGSLKSAVIDEFRRHQASLRALAGPIVSIPIPLGFFKNFLVEKNGKYKNTVNIKVNGLLPLTTCVKLLAFYAGITEVNTLERIRRLAQKGIIPADRSEFIEQAFETFLGFKIRNNLSNLDQGRDFSNNINPSELGTRQKQLLKDSFLAVSEIQKITKDVLRVVEEM